MESLVERMRHMPLISKNTSHLEKSVLEQKEENNILFFFCLFHMRFFTKL